MKDIKIDLTAGDPEPSDEQRGDYVARVAGFYHDIGKDKLNHLINDFAKEAINPDMPEEERQKIILTINGISLFLDWMERITSEHIANSLPEETKDEDAFNQQ